MAKKKNGSEKPVNKEAIHVKIAGALGTVAGQIMNTRDQIVEVAGGAIGSLKSSIQNITIKKKAAPKKAGSKKPVAKKTAQVVNKKTSAVTAPVISKKAPKKAVNKKAVPAKKTPVAEPAGSTGPIKKPAKPAASKKAVVKKPVVKKAAKKTALKK